MLKSYPPGAFRRIPPTIQREFRGVNTLDPFSIDDRYASECKNLTSRNYPTLTVRPGYTVLGTYGSKVLGMGIWQETELHAVFNDGTWRRLNNDGTWTTLATGLNTTATWSFTNFEGNLGGVCLIGSNGVDTPMYYNGSGLFNLTGVPSGGKYITQYADRLWCVVGNELKASAYRMATDWTTTSTPSEETDSWFAVIETPDGEQVNGLMDGLTKLVITKPSSVHELYGYSPIDYGVRPVTFDTGQFNNNSGITLDGWLYQLYSTGLHRYSGGSTPKNDFSERIKGYFDSLNSSGKTSSCIGTDGRRIYFSIPINSSTPDTIIEYDPKLDTYYPWKGISALFFAQIETTLYIGDAFGRVLRLGGITDNGSAISWNWVSKPFTGRSMSQTIRWMRMWDTADLPAGSTLSVDLSKYPSGDNWESVGSLTASTDVQRQPIYVASTKVANAKQIRYRLSGSGPCTTHEVAWEQEELPLV